MVPSSLTILYAPHFLIKKHTQMTLQQCAKQPLFSST
jgi:hypothetical protein